MADTPLVTPDPFERLNLACMESYRDRQAVACVLVMSHETQRAFVRHTPRYMAGWPERSGAFLRQVATPFGGRMADVDIDDTLPYGVVRVRFEIPHEPLPEYFWRAFAVMAVGER